MRLRSSLGLLLVLSSNLSAQTPEQRYKVAKAIFAKHSDGFLMDDSPEATRSVQQMWSAVGDLVINRRTKDPKVSSATLDYELCLLTAEPMPPEAIQMSAEEQCQPQISLQRREVLELGKGLLLVAPFSGEIGTVFLVGPREGRLALLWSIAEAGPQPHDPHDLIGAWRLDRAGDACRAKGSPHKPGACGPLYAGLGLLPPDKEGHPRFYIDAGYAQQMGATVANQTSIWLWNGVSAELLWSDWHDVMLEQSRGTDFANGILSVVSKASFRSFFSCGSCEERQLEHDVLIEPTRIRDLGTKSLVPELDAVDTLFWRISHRQSTAGLASPKVVARLRPLLAESRIESARITPGFFTTGMMDDSLVTHTRTGATVCLTADDLGQFVFSLRRQANGGYYISRAVESGGSYEACETRAWLPQPSAEPG